MVKNARIGFTREDDSRVVLASASPRRREILGMLGFRFETREANIDESPRRGEWPMSVARRLAWAKATAVASVNAIVIASDTIVVFENAILGKPRDEADAWEMLTRLRGRRHQVISGLAIVGGPTGMDYIDGVTTGVWMRDYSDEEIQAYVDSGDPLDKAGAYGIQNESFHPVARIEGCYLNVVGLPLCEVVKGLGLVAPFLKWSKNWPLSHQMGKACRSCPLLENGR